MKSWQSRDEHWCLMWISTRQDTSEGGQISLYNPWKVDWVSNGEKHEKKQKLIDELYEFIKSNRITIVQAKN